MIRCTSLVACTSPTVGVYMDGKVSTSSRPSELNRPSLYSSVELAFVFWLCHKGVGGRFLPVSDTRRAPSVGYDRTKFLFSFLLTSRLQSLSSRLFSSERVDIVVCVQIIPSLTNNGGAALLSATH